MYGDEPTLRERLDERYADILHAVGERGGTATTSEIKALTGIDTNQIITQRMDRLAEWDLVTLTYRKTNNNPNQLPTKVASLTEYGRQTVESGLLEEFRYGNDRVDTVERLNGRVRRQARRIEQQRKRLRAIEQYLTEEVKVDLDEYGN